MVKTKKSLGQHWLHDPVSLQAMCDLAQVGDGDIVLEVGPGLGTLTEYLVKQAKQVVAVEFDDDLAADLPHRVTADNLQVVHGDILSFDLSTLPAGYKVIANIPYYLTSNLVRVLSESSNPAQSLTLLIQKEVAERIAAQPGDMSLLGLTAQLYFEPELGPLVAAELFAPPPKVDSQIIHLQRRDQPQFAGHDKTVLIRVLKAGFSNKRKTLHNSLAAGLHISKPEAQALLEQAKINPLQRPQSLAISDWLRLTDVVVAASIKSSQVAHS